MGKGNKSRKRASRTLPTLFRATAGHAVPLCTGTRPDMRPVNATTHVVGRKSRLQLCYLLCSYFAKLQALRDY